MTHDDLADLALARELALTAGAVHLRYAGALGEGDVQWKSRRDPVTKADLEAEQCILDGLRAARPHDSILAEESGARDGEPSGVGPAGIWIVDPLDGTVNFQYGIPMSAVSIAKRVGNQLRVGVVYLPELGELYCARAEGGAELNGKALRVREPVELEDAVLGTGFAYRRDEYGDDNVDHAAHFVRRARDLRRMGSAAADLAFVAAGRLDGFWEIHLNAWDLAAGALLVREAGGVVTDVGGGDEFEATGSIVAAGPNLHPRIVEELRANGLRLDSFEDP